MKFFESYNDYFKINESVGDEIFAYVVKRRVSDLPTDEQLKGEINKIVPQLQVLLKKNPGYVAPFAKMYMNDESVDFDALKALYDFIVKYSALVPRLPKSIVQYTDYEELNDDLDALVLKQKSKSIADELPSFLKQQLKEASTEIQERFSDLAYKLYTREDKRTFLDFISKYKTLAELMNHLEIFVLNEFTYDAILQKIDNTENVKLFQTDTASGRIIAKIFSFSASQSLGAPSWCIATGEWSWNNYNGIDKNSIQYFIWNTKKDITDPEFQIGVTVELDKGKLNYREICDKNNTQMSSTEMLKASGLKRGSLPGPSQQDFSDKLKIADLENGVMSKYLYRDTALKTAVENNYPDLFKELYTKYGTTDPNQNKVILESMAKLNRIDIFKWYIDVYKPEPNSTFTMTIKDMRDIILSQLAFELLDVFVKKYPGYGINTMVIPYRKLKVADLDKLLSYAKKETGKSNDDGNAPKDVILASIAVNSMNSTNPNIEMLQAVLGKGLDPMKFKNINLVGAAISANDMKSLDLLLSRTRIDGDLMYDLLFYNNDTFNNLKTYLDKLKLSKDDFIKFTKEACARQASIITNRFVKKLYSTDKLHLRSVIRQCGDYYGYDAAEEAFKEMTDLITKDFSE